METPSIQPSFIPKGQSASGAPFRARGSFSLFTVIASVIFILALGGYGGTWFYKGHLTRSNEDKKARVDAEIKSFDNDLTRELTLLKQRLDMGQKLLQSHVAVSTFFTLLENITAQTVRFSDLQLTSVASKYSVALKGEAISYTAAAFQSDIFAKNPGIISPIFSNLSISDKGIIGFDVKMDLDPSTISYIELVKKNSAVEPPTEPSEPVASSTPQS